MTAFSPPASLRGVQTGCGQREGPYSLPAGPEAFFQTAPLPLNAKGAWLQGDLRDSQTPPPLEFPEFRGTGGRPILGLGAGLYLRVWGQAYRRRKWTLVPARCGASRQVHSNFRRPPPRFNGGVSLRVDCMRPR